MKTLIKLLLPTFVVFNFAFAEVDEVRRAHGVVFDITFSKYDSDEHFTEWVSRANSQLEIEQQSEQGNYALITEVGGQHFKRRIFEKTLGWTTTRSGRLFKDFATYHKQNYTKGYELLTLTCFVDQFSERWYSATWVLADKIDLYQPHLSKYGISQAKVEMRMKE